jgi:hypothetical protein
MIFDEIAPFGGVNSSLHALIKMLRKARDRVKARFADRESIGTQEYNGIWASSRPPASILL